MRLGAAVAMEPSFGELWIEVLLPAGIGEGSAAPLPTKRGRRPVGSNSRIAMDYSHVTRLGARNDRLVAALRSASDDDSRIVFVLKAAVGRVAKEVGEGHLSLRKLLRDGADAVGSEVALRGELGNVGTLAVSVFAIAAMQSVEAGSSQVCPGSGT